MTSDELEQQLWELEYGLLSEEEAAILRALVESDPEIAELYRRVRANSAVVAEAARIDAPRIKFRIPRPDTAESNTGDSSAASAPIAGPVQPPYSRRIRRFANWSLSLSTSLLIGLLAWTAWPKSGPSVVEIANMQSDSERGSVRIRVDTPAQLSSEANNPIAVRTTVDGETPTSVELQVSAKNKQGHSFYSKAVATDSFGRAFFELPSQLPADAKLNITYGYDAGLGMQVDLARAENQYTTCLTTDKPTYRPGDVVRYRSLTLSRFGLKADREVKVDFLITDPNGQEVPGSNLTGKTQRGVGNGESPLQPDAPPGKYTLFARNAEHIFPEVTCDFLVSKGTPRQYDIAVKWDDEKFAAGTTATGQVAVRTPAGQPASDVKLWMRGYVDGHQVALSTPEIPTDRDGNAHFSLALPSQISSTDGDLAIRAGEQGDIWRDIPLQANQVLVEFYPEGGDLAAGIENRVYFHAHDMDGRPIAMRGRVLDAGQREVAVVTTQHEGRGVFPLTPTVNETYFLAIDDPPAIESQPPLPVPTEQNRLVMDAAPGVFRGDDPIKLRLRSKAPPAEFAVVAYCRGITAGQIAGAATDFKGAECEVDLPLIADAAGVLRVTVFDYSKQPPEPLAERLVFRLPRRKLNLQIAGLSPRYAARETVNGQILATDERGQPVSATLGVSVVDKTVLESSAPSIPRMATHFWLLGDIDRADKLEDANFYLAEGDPSAVAIDLLLGTQGWRRFQRSRSELAAEGRVAGDGLAYRATAGFGAEAEKAQLGKNQSLSELELFSWQSQVRILDEAPRRFDNRIAVESLKREAAGVRPAMPIQNPQPDSRKFPISAGLGLAAIILVSVMVRWRPTTKAVIQGILAIGALGTLLAIYHWSVWWNAQQVSRGVAKTASQAAPAAQPNAALDQAEELQATIADPASGAEIALPQEDRPAPSAPESAPQVFAPKTEPAATSAPAPGMAGGMGGGAGVRPLAPADAARPGAAATVPADPVRVPAAPAPAPKAPAPEPATPPAPATPAPALKSQAPAPKTPAPAPANPATAPALPLPRPDRVVRDELTEETRDRFAVPMSQSERLTRQMQRLDSPQKLSDVKEKAADQPAGGAAEVDRLSAEKKQSNFSDAASRSRAGVKATTSDDKSLATRIAAAAPEGTAEGFTIRQYAYPLWKARGDSRRDDFTESVYWHPLMITDEAGRATFEFGLPDTVTEFRVLVEGHTDGRLGEAQQAISTAP